MGLPIADQFGRPKEMGKSPNELIESNQLAQIQLETNVIWHTVKLILDGSL